MKTKRERGIDFVIINLGLFLVAAGIHFFKIDKNLLLVDGSKETHSCVSRIF